MGLIKRELEKFDANDRAYSLVVMLIVTISLPVLLMKHVNLLFGVMYLFTPFILMHKEIQGYLVCIRKEVIALIILTVCAVLITFSPGSEGPSALFAAIYVIGGVILGLRSLNQLLRYMESIGVE